MYIYRDNKVRKIKDGITLTELRLSGYFDKHPSAVVCNKPPSTATLDHMAESGSATAIDGCRGIEPDGTCPHGLPSWLLALGYI
jgi:hypothetical protein